MSALRKLYAVACCLLALFVAPAMAQPQGRLVVSTLQSTSFYFDGATFSRTGPDSFTVYFLNRSEGQERETLVIPFRRTSGPARRSDGAPS